jgi:hypothetical protein
MFTRISPRLRRAKNSKITLRILKPKNIVVSIISNVFNSTLERNSTSIFALKGKRSHLRRPLWVKENERFKMK